MSSEEVDAFLDHRFDDKTKACEYLVQWSSDMKKNWEPLTSLTECDQLLCAYWRQRIEKDGPSKSYLRQEPNPLYVEEHKQAGPSKRKQPSSVKKKPSANAKGMVDRIATAKRVQQRKQLGNALAKQRAANTERPLQIKPPPPLAKRSTGAMDEAMDEAVDVNGMAVLSMRSPSLSVSTADGQSEGGTPSPSKPKMIQRARKSTGGRHPKRN
ncbi:hypothetical protein GGI23_005334 [Coemansia sp. RSA 2559]|nr:hypothetical protein GGI23_005334 [Coemansia sp. RSA 2559]KAJ2852938.1 hypothetical protein GGI22_005074 [Coemansia erecta]